MIGRTMSSAYHKKARSKSKVQQVTLSIMLRPYFKPSCLGGLTSWTFSSFNVHIGTKTCVELT